MRGWGNCVTTWMPLCIKSTPQVSGIRWWTPCKHCHEIDHTASDCGVAAFLPKAPLSRLMLPPHWQSARAARGSGQPPTPVSKRYVAPGMQEVADSLAGVRTFMSAPAAMGATLPQTAASVLTHRLGKSLQGDKVNCRCYHPKDMHEDCIYMDSYPLLTLGAHARGLL